MKKSYSLMLYSLIFILALGIATIIVINLFRQISPNQKLVSAQAVLQEVKFNPKYTSTTYYVDVILKAKKWAWVGPIPTWWNDNNIFVFSGKIRTCYEFDKINKDTDIVITAEKIKLLFPAPTFCDDKDLSLDIQNILTQGDRDEAQAYLKGIARPLILLFSMNRGIMDDDSVNRDLSYFQAMLESFAGKKVEIEVKDLAANREKIETELRNEIKDKLNKDGISVDLISTDFMKDFFEELKNTVSQNNKEKSIKD